MSPTLGRRSWRFQCRRQSTLSEREIKTELRTIILTRTLLNLPWLVLLGWLTSVSWFLSDDAFISFRYVRNLLEGHGLVFNPGEYVEGYSNFLWILELAAIWGIWGVRPEHAAPYLSVSASCICKPTSIRKTPGGCSRLH